jgi:hypothetical protein
MYTFAMLLDWFTFFAGAYWLVVIGVFTWVFWCVARMRIDLTVETTNEKVDKLADKPKDEDLG